MTEIEHRSDMTVELVTSNASDSGVATAARVSTVGGTHANAVDLVRDEGLINFLMRERHGSPFEHNSFTFYVEAPVFVAREHFRHRAGWSYNETSGRYRELEPVFYMPDEFRPLVQVGKPGAYTFEAGSEVQWYALKNVLSGSYRDAYSDYRDLLERGIAREVARTVLPVGIYTSYYATCNARSLMHFLSLRTQSEAAKFPSFPLREIELVASGMERSLRKQMPITWAAFQKAGRVTP